MNKQDKPRICVVLGVEVGERFRISFTDSEYYINECGEMMCISHGFHLKCGRILETIINYPDHIIRKPRFSSEEIADARAFMKVWPGEEIGFSRSPNRSCMLIHRKDGQCNYLLMGNVDLFPSIRPGQVVKLSEICGGDAE